MENVCFNIGVVDYECLAVFELDGVMSRWFFVSFSVTVQIAFKFEQNKAKNVSVS